MTSWHYSVFFSSCLQSLMLAHNLFVAKTAFFALFQFRGSLAGAGCVHWGPRLWIYENKTQQQPQGSFSSDNQDIFVVIFWDTATIFFTTLKLFKRTGESELRKSQAKLTSLASELFLPLHGQKLSALSRWPESNQHTLSSDLWRTSWENASKWKEVVWSINWQIHSTCMKTKARKNANFLGSVWGVQIENII